VAAAVTKAPARLWLPCPCGANLASVTYQADDPDSNGTGMVVRTRPVVGLIGRVHRDPPEARSTADAERVFMHSLARASIPLRPDGERPLGGRRRHRRTQRSVGNYYVWYEWWHPCDEQSTAHCVVTLDEICELCHGMPPGIAIPGTYAERARAHRARSAERGGEGSSSRKASVELTDGSR
jgi:hypothetical protein